MTIRSAPHLFALARGGDCAGPGCCHLCGAPRGEEHPAALYVLASFTARDTVACPGSPFVCAGCVLAMRGDADVTLADGAKGRYGKVWMYSWLVTPSEVRAYATSMFHGNDLCRAHRPLVRAICLAPPEPPYAIALTTTGQKHVLYRTRVCRSTGFARVCLDGEDVAYRPADLASRIALSSRLCAASGPLALRHVPSASLALAACSRRQDGASDLTLWEACREESLSALALFLLPSKEDCQNAYPSDR